MRIGLNLKFAYIGATLVSVAPMALAACDQGEEPPPTPDPTPTATATPAPSATPQPAATATPTPTPSHTPAPQPDAPLAFDPKVVRGTLSNGLSYYIRHNEEPQGRAQISLAVKAGSVHETDDQQGLAHFVEHMAFNGTERFAKEPLRTVVHRWLK